MQIRFLNWQLSLERVFVGEQQLAQMYDGAASSWDRSIERMGTPQAYAALFEKLRTAQQLPAAIDEVTILDAGLGTGALTAALVPHLPQAHYTGIDLSPEMLAVAADSVPIDLQCDLGSVNALPYADDSFDYVMSAHVVEHLAVPAQGIAELLRVLKPGQPFVLVATRRCPVSTLLSLRWNFAPLLPWRVRHWLQAAGAEQTTMEPLRPKMHISYMSTVYTGRKRG